MKMQTESNAEQNGDPSYEKITPTSADHFGMKEVNSRSVCRPSDWRATHMVTDDGGVVVVWCNSKSAYLCILRRWAHCNDIRTLDRRTPNTVLPVVAATVVRFFLFRWIFRRAIHRWPDWAGLNIREIPFFDLNRNDSAANVISGTQHVPDTGTDTQRRVVSINTIWKCVIQKRGDLGY